MEIDTSHMETFMAQNGTELSSAAMAMQDMGPYTPKDMLFALRCYFYLWTPSETMFKTLGEVPNMFTRVIRYMPLLIVFECIGLALRGKSLPRWNHSLMSMCTAIMVFLPSSIIGNVEFTWFSMLYDKYRIVDISWNSVPAWFLCFFACDLGSYLWHRAAHEVNFVWSFHSVHHTSDEINIMAGYRLPTFNRQIAIMFYLPMAFIFPPAMFYTHYQLNYVTQLWVHTNIFEGGDWLAKFIITPRLHRVHHARNRYCIDKNYGAVLSCWDRLFGTFEPYREDVPLSYGLVGKLESFDPVAVQFKYFNAIFQRACTYDNWGDRISCYLKGPGWEPGKPRLGVYEEIPEKYEGDDDISYDKKNPSWCYAYITWTLTLAILLYSTVSQTKEMLGSGIGAVQVLYVFWMVANSGYFLEQKPWVPVSEVLRCGSYFIMETMIHSSLSLYPALMTTFRYTSILSLFLWSFKLNMFSPKDSIKSE